ncbi:MAG: nitroreductase family protein [bacterium]
MTARDTSTLPPENEDSRRAGDSFMELLERRRSTRMFKEAPVPRELLERLIRAATLLPTSCNRQLWHFVVVTDQKLKVKVSELSDAQQSYLYDAPALIAVFYDSSLETRNPCRTAEVTVGMTIGAILLAAEAHRLGAIYLGGIRRPAGIAKALGVPSYLRSFGLVCVGWRDDDPPSPNRRPVEDVLSFNEFKLPRERYHADIRPHLWKLSQIADFRDKLLWYKGVHIDGKTLHVDSDSRFSQKFQFMIGRLGMMISRHVAPQVLDVLSFNGDVVLQLLNSCGGQLGKLYAYDLTQGTSRYITERFRQIAPPGNVTCLVNSEVERIAIPLQDGQVQVISCYERLEHFEDPRPLLREMHRVLAADGRVLLVVSNRSYPHMYRYKRMRRKDYSLGRNWNRGPERKYDHSLIERYLRETGFEVAASFGLQPVHLKAVGMAAAVCRRLGSHSVADRLVDWCAQRYVTEGRGKNLSSSIAYELVKT